MLAARVLAIVRGWSAWRALQGCRPHRRQAKDGAAILARLADGDGPEGHLVKFLKKIFAARGDATRPRPAPPRQSSANWPGNRRPEPSGRPYRPCFSHRSSPLYVSPSDFFYFTHYTGYCARVMSVSESLSLGPLCLSRSIGSSTRRRSLTTLTSVSRVPAKHKEAREGVYFRTA